MKKQLQRLTQIALMLFVFGMMLTNVKAQTVGSQIRIGADSTISYWNGSEWVAVPPGLPGQSLQFNNGYNANYSTIPTNGLVANYPFNGNANDESNNGNNGTVNGATLTTDRFGKPNSAYSFNGSYIEIPDNVNLHPQSYTISAWVNFSDYSGVRMILAKNAGNSTAESIGLWYMGQYITNIGGSNYGSNWITYSGDTPFNKWFFLTSQYDNTTGILTLFINGNVIASGTAGCTIGYDGQPWSIGTEKENGGYNYFFNGKIDDIRIYDRILSASEIQTLYHEGGWPYTVKWIDGPQTPPHDIDGNVYEAVTIGTQTWMKQNLNVTHYRNGDAILTNITDNGAWSNLTTGAYCNYNNDANNAITYGRLYNWYTVVDSRNLCPTGWHVPSDAEWTTLTDYLGGESIAGGKLKEAGLAHWQSPNSEATNETGFTALPSGFRFVDGSYNDINHDGFWWSSTEYNTGEVWARYMHYGYGSTGSYWVGKLTGFSVRCLKD
ncbi:MAG: FISUMP domain-containing protein [Bacteroidota bacterium]